MSIGVSRLLGLAFLWPLNDMSLAIPTVISVFTFIDVHNCESSVICAHPLLHGVAIGNVALGMLLQMTMITGMEADTRPSTAEAIMEMGRATTTLGEQQQLQLLEGVQLHQLLLLAKLCSTQLALVSLAVLNC